MNIPVKRAKSTALGKMCNPSRSPTKHRKRPFPLKRHKKGPLGSEMGLLFGTEKNFIAITIYT